MEAAAHNTVGTPPVRWGILGTSRIAKDLMIPAMRNSNWCELVGVASRSQARADSYARDHSIPNGYGSYEKLLDDPSIEAVYVSLPNNMHAEYTLAALKRGKHVLCEKPAAMSTSELAELKQAVRDLIFAEAFMIRHHPQWHFIRRIIDANAIGEPKSVQVSMSFTIEQQGDYRLSPALGGGATYDLAGYCALVGRMVYGREPQRVTSHMSFDRSGVDRLATGIMDFGQGSHLSFVVGNELAASQSVKILGTSGSLYLPEPFLPRGGVGSVTVQNGSYFDPQVSIFETAPCDQYQSEIEAFSRAVRGVVSLEFGLTEAMCQMRAIEAIFEASRSQSWVTV
jgi:predicted dehydrogenase